MLAQRPPLGWNTWNTFGKDISEALILETAEAMVKRGFKDAGYEYVVIDDCWSLHERDKAGRLVADPEKFPHGMKYLADQIHGLGLKFGMYSCCGTLTCAGYPGSYDYEFIDAETFADWGVDYLKYDNCFRSDNHRGPDLYYRMGTALRAVDREILFSACNWGMDDVWSWARSAGAHMYRSTGDIFDNAESFRALAMSQLPKLSQSAPGCYNDPDMLICGMYNQGNVASGGCTDAEYAMHFALWCMMGSPLMIGCDIRNCSEETKELLQNRKLLRIDQDEEARPPFHMRSHGSNADVAVLAKHLSDGELAIGVFNFTEHDVSKCLQQYDLGFTTGCGYTAHLSEVFTEEPLRMSRSTWVHVPAHSCKVFLGKIVKE